MPLKVSVVVPAYCPGDGIGRVVDSLAAQTMPQDEFELIIVDDGSPDDTWERLQRIRDARPNVRIERIENSGWPSRPRNVGIDMARGEYVLFMDHDDEIFPDGLRASYEYALAHHADVLSPKELKTSDPTWGLGNFTSNIPNALPRRGIDALLPMMPHKFYRREFLLEHDIRFPEGRRMLWEDVYFNVACFKYAEVVSILSETPVYLWHSTGANNSATYGPWEAEFWDRLSLLFDFIADTLDPDDEREATGRKKQLMHQYHLRVILRLEAYLRSGQHPDRIDFAVDQALAIIDKHIPESWDLELPALVRPRAWLLRRREIDLMRRLQELDSSYAGLAETTSVTWREGTLHIESQARWRSADGEPMRFAVRGGRIVRELPAAFAQVPVQHLDVTDEVTAASTVLTVRDRTSHVTWNLPTKATMVLERLSTPGEPVEHLAEGEVVTILVRAESTLDPATAGMGDRLGPAVWDVRARNAVLGALHHRLIQTRTPGRPALIDGRPAVAYRNQSGGLSVDLAQGTRTVANNANPRIGASRVATSGLVRRTITMTIPLGRVHVHGTTRIDGVAEVEARPPDDGGAAADRGWRRWVLEQLPRKAEPGRARLVAGPDGVVLTADVTAVPGRWRLVLTLGERRAESLINLDIPVRGAARLTSRKPKPGRRRGPKTPDQPPRTA